MRIFPLHATDFYKVNHIAMYPRDTTLCYSNFTPRSDKLANLLPDFDHKVVFFGLQGVIRWLLIDTWNREFFHRPRSEVVAKYARRMDSSLGVGAVATDHIAALHDLGYLPLRIKALPEGSRVNIRVPVFTVVNTDPRFYWLTNYVETMLSAECWKSITTATVAYEYRRLLDSYAERTGSPREFVQWQGHDFSMRGMSGIHDAVKSGAGHLLSFTGTDTIGAIDYLEDYYHAENDFVGGSVPATEHSVMCMGGCDGETETFRRLVQDLYPSGVISIVSDTWDFWKVLTEYAAQLKPVIEARTPNALGLAKVVFRPDSGDPVKIICGDEDAPPGSPASKGAIGCLWDVFGGSLTSTGHRMLNPRVGLIYGDSITLDRARRILERLDDLKFASGNVVFGIGSYTYQHVTRDTFGHAYKATFGVVDGEDRELFKDPITDSGSKKSARGLLRVDRLGDDFVLRDRVTRAEEYGGELRTVFVNGYATDVETLAGIRARLLGSGA
jgi:nicotinamide phosphoribosyltransferase